MSVAPPKTSHDILNIIHAHADKLRELGAARVGLFGSRARDEGRLDSDVDILLTLTRPSFDDYMEIKFYLEDLLSISVDLVLEDGLKPVVRPYVLAEVIYAERLQTE